MHTQLLSISAAALGRALRTIRTRRGLSQEAVELRGGPHRNYVGAVERAEVNPTFSSLLKFATALDTPLSAVIALAEHIAERDGI